MTFVRRGRPQSEQPNREIPPRASQVGRLIWPMLLFALACGDSGTDPGGTDPVAVGPATLRLEPSSLDLWVQDTARVVATVLDELGDTVSDLSVEWSSDDPTVATVASGLVRGITSGGSTRIRASVAGLSSSIPVSVDDPRVAALFVVQDSISLVQGDGLAPEWFALDVRNDGVPPAGWSR